MTYFFFYKKIHFINHNYFFFFYIYIVGIYDTSEVFFSMLNAPHYSSHMLIFFLAFFFFDLRGVSGPAYAHHDYSSRPTGYPASPGAGKAPRG
jgi:hypothetical protein